MAGGTPPDGPRPGEMVFDMALHGLGFPAYQIGQFGIVRGRRIGEHRQRRLQSVSEIAGMHARFFRLLFGMGEERVDFLHQRFDLEREGFGNAVRAFAAHGLDGVAHAPQRRKTVPALQHGKGEKAHAQRREAPDQDRADPGDLIVEFAAGGGDGEGPFRIAVGQHDRTLDDAQGLAFELVGIVEMRLLVDVIAMQFETAIPQAAAGKGLMPFARDLPVDPAVGLQKTLVPEGAVELHIAETVDFGRGDQRGLDVFQLLVEIILHQPDESTVEREAAAEQQDADPQRGNHHHAPRKAAPRRRMADGHRIFGRRGRRRDLPDRRRLAAVSVRMRAAGRRDRRGCNRVHGSS